MSSETFVIQDCIKYYGTSYSQSSIVNLDLPSEYKIEFTLFSNSSVQTSGGRSNVCFLRFDSSSGGYVGKGSSISRNTGISATFLPNSVPVSVDTEYTFSKENGVVYLSDGTDTINLTSSAFTKLYEIRGSTDGQIKNVKVKPL